MAWREQGRAVLDVPDEDGITPRQRMADAQQQLGQIPGAAAETPRDRP